MGKLKYKFWIVSSILLVFLVPISTGNIISKGKGNPKLIIDQDAGADDAMAIFMAFLYEKYFNGPSVIALTTVHGNVDEHQAFINTQRILDIADRREVPIYRGNNESLVTSVPSDGYFGADGLGDNNFGAVQPIKAQNVHAALGIIKLTNKYPGKVILVAIGALTNIALAVRLEPQLINRLSHLYVGAGNVYSENKTKAEFNAKQDAEAYHIIMQKAHPAKVTIVPFSQVRTRGVSRQWRQEVLGAIPTKIMRAQNAFERISVVKNDYLALLDPVVMGMALNRAIVGEVKYSQNSIILCGADRGINTNNFTTYEEANVNLINKVIDEEYKDLLLSIFTAELQ
ncbi:inosine-uridine preferring nucleoside hydrolase-like [Leguminivora glycinivorella]|uniref:inosine-uridine preferring nucleoside hydrolase-like n=1 Tax=Leguminivora glycinivorella TaxID=1035111 RepID=UPI00200EBF39|nr:inosine-uridine preferring nucleoside hydrolase-like [Leguminivora glycinivorella]